MEPNPIQVDMARIAEVYAAQRNSALNEVAMLTAAVRQLQEENTALAAQLAQLGASNG